MSEQQIERMYENDAWRGHVETYKAFAAEFGPDVALQLVKEEIENS